MYEIPIIGWNYTHIYIDIDIDIYVCKAKINRLVFMSGACTPE
jgi:hypothetical protein